MNRLYYGDNITIMRDRMKSSQVDLIYLDPPFNSKKNYNMMYRTLTGKPVPEQADAFCDTWEMDPEKERRAKDAGVDARAGHRRLLRRVLASVDAGSSGTRSLTCSHI